MLEYPWSKINITFTWLSSLYNPFKSSFRSWHFCLEFLVILKNGLIRKLRLTPKFMTSQIGQQIITIHILSNISRSKDNQTMRFGQLTEQKIRNIGKSYTKYGGEASPRPFHKKSKSSISLVQKSAMLWSFILLYVQVGVYQNILKQRCWPFAFTLYKVFLKKQKEVWN